MTAIDFNLIRKAAASMTQPLPGVAPRLRVQSRLGQMLTQSNETPQEIAKLVSALGHLSPDAGRGNGRLFDERGLPVDDYWLGCIWAINGLNWTSGEQIAREWSQGINRRAYSETEFCEDWESYDPGHQHPVTIASVYKRAAVEGWAYSNTLHPVLTAVPPNHQPRYRLLNADDITKLKPAGWRVKGIFPEIGLGAIFGPSASGKSFLAFDLAATIASGESWFGIKTIPSEVIYIMLEGEAGLQNRIRAWETARHKPLPTTLRMILQPIDLMSQQDPADLLTVLPSDSVIFIDTLNRASPTADENTSRDMGQILSSAKSLSLVTRGLVILVHHTGKDVMRGMRGHSSLFAALDGAIEVTRDIAGSRSWSVTKTKDGEDGKSTGFRLQVHMLGKDPDGDDITSCSVERDGSVIFKPRRPQGKIQQLALSTIKTALSMSDEKGKCGTGADTSCLAVEEAINQVANKLTTVAANKRVNRARSLIEGLIVGGFLTSGIEFDEGWLW